MKSNYIVYLITHRPTGVVYVGQAQAKKQAIVKTSLLGHLPARFAEHAMALERGDHFNAALQHSWRGSLADFAFNVIEHLEAVDLKTALEAERRWIKAFPEVFNQRSRIRSTKVRQYSAEVRAQVIALLRAGESGKRVASKTGVSTGTVSLIRKAAGLQATCQRS